MVFFLKLFHVITVKLGFIRQMNKKITGHLIMFFFIKV